MGPLALIWIRFFLFCSMFSLVWFTFLASSDFTVLWTWSSHTANGKSVKADTLSDTWRYFSKLPHMPCSHAVDIQNSILSSRKLHKSKKELQHTVWMQTLFFFYHIHNLCFYSFSSDPPPPQIFRGFFFLKKPKALVDIFNIRDSLTGQILKWFCKKKKGRMWGSGFSFYGTIWRGQFSILTAVDHKDLV